MATFFLTFGQAHAHRVNNITLDKDIVGVITAESEGKARDIAFSLFGRVWAFLYTEAEFEGKLKYFPRGTVELN